jgi:hypothetical protein
VALYYLAAPLAVIHPYLCFVPWLDEVAEGRALAPQWQRALQQLGWAALYTGLACGLPLVRPWTPIAVATFMDTLFAVGQLVHVIHALMLLHGFACRDPIHWPLASSSYLDFWRRFQVHLKDVQVMLFYLPLMMRLRRWNRFLAIAVSLAVTLIVFNTAVHVCTRYVFVADVGRRAGWALAVNAVNWAVLAASLCVVELRQRAKAGAVPAFARALGWVGTLALAAVTT